MDDGAGANAAIERIEAAQQAAAGDLVSPGDWLDGAQRADAWREARAARDHPLDRARRAAVSPNAVEGRHDATAHLSVEAVEVVHRVSSDPGRLARPWAHEAIDALGVETYTELVGVTAIAACVDTYATALGRPWPTIPAPASGDPARIRPDDVGDVGAWVPQALTKTVANVSRTLSLVPRTNSTWRSLVDSHYSRGAEFFELSWDRALSRPQVELLAARTTAELSCFY